MIYRNISISFAAFIMLVGCTQKVPPCSDVKTIENVKNIYKQSLQEELSRIHSNIDVNTVMNNIPINITAIRTSNNDKKARKCSCEAVIEAKLPEKFADPLNKSPFSSTENIKGAILTLGYPMKYENSTLSCNIEYISQLTDDKNEHIVQARGHSPLAKMISLISYDLAK
jgi:hypothetical protein